MKKPGIAPLFAFALTLFLLGIPVIALAVDLAGLSVSPNSGQGGTNFNCTVKVFLDASSTGVNVTLSSSNPAAATVPPSVTVWGSNFAQVPCNTYPVTQPTSVTITASRGSVTKTAQLTVLPPPGTLTSISVPQVYSDRYGGKVVLGSVGLSGPAPSGGRVVTLSSSTPAATVPTSVTVAANTTTANFNIQTNPVGTKTAVTITASAGGVTKTAGITVEPPIPNGISVSPTSEVGGKEVPGKVFLLGAAPSEGFAVALSSSAPAAATVPASATAAAGTTSASFTVRTNPVGQSTPVTITAGNKTATLTVLPPAPVSITLNPTSVRGRDAATGQITLNGAAPSGGFAVALSSSAQAATVPASVTVVAGATTASFTVNTSQVRDATTATITASAGGTNISSSLTVNPPGGGR